LGHYFYSNRNLYDAKVVYKDPKEKSYDEKTIRMKYPLNYLWQEKKDVIDSLKTNEDEKGCAIVLYAAKITKQKGKQRLDQIKTLVKAISWNGDDPPDEDYCHGLQEFCAFLHPNIATPSITPYAHIPTLSPKEFQALCTLHSNTSLGFSIWISYGVVESEQGRY
jgi:hypothetical protein